MDKTSKIIKEIEHYTDKYSLRTIVSVIGELLRLNDMSDLFNLQHVIVINETGEVNVLFHDGRACIIRSKPTKLKKIYKTLSEIGVDIDSFDHIKDSIPSLEKFFVNYDNKDNALYHWSGESAGFFLDDYVNATTLQPEDICWELQENV